MKQVLEDFRNGQCRVEDVPAPIARPGFVVVRNHFSVISSGTEGGTVKLGKASLIGKALARPEQVRKVLQVAMTQGVMTAWNATQRTLDMPVPLGYSCAGTVVETGAGVTGLAPGDRVACGGAGFANHAEVVCVPRNLCVPVPAGAALEHAAFTTIGAIALQSVRVAQAQLGEDVVVIGLGLVGLVTAQILRAAGCRVFGIDLDPARLEFARAQGYGECAALADANLRERVLAFSRGHGADVAIITATTDDNGPVALAGELVRRKGRVVVVGRTVMTAPRETYLFKELELRTSMAYGPGTGDVDYEERGIDYPYAYVRWTEQRNMAAFLDLIAGRRIDLEPLLTHRFAIDRAGEAFELITGPARQGSMAVLLDYTAGLESEQAPTRVVARGAASAGTASGRLRVGVIGAGSFATNEFLPLLAAHGGLHLRAIASGTGVRARALAGKYGFDLAASDPLPLLDDPQIDCVFILTRHDTHAEFAARALAAGKHVFVEKPLALDDAELDRVERAWAGADRTLMVGFNRRYAPLAVRLKEHFGVRAQPAAVTYRANVGYRPPEHWLHDPRQGGGVILGEACHHIDFCNWLVGAAPVGVNARALGGQAEGFIAADNVYIDLDYADGSRATVAYLSNGSKAYSSERVEVLCDNRAGSVEDFRRIELAAGLRLRRDRLWLKPDKGHAAQVAAFIAAASGAGGASIDTAGYLASSRAAIAAAHLVAAAGGGRP
ncbi:MAG: bi-domain-containing oxidoreductase [Gammaproteobacteria bacterium]